MVVTDSYELYCRACHIGGQYFSQKYPSGHRVGEEMADILEEYYIRIINLMFYELITMKNSKLLSYLCSVNQIFPNVINFEIIQHQCTYKNTYDIISILAGINIVFVKDLNECRNLYRSNFKTCTFNDMVFFNEPETKRIIESNLRDLDKNIGNIVLRFKNNKKELKQECMNNIMKEPETKTANTVCRVHDPKLTEKLNKYANERREYDVSLLERIQQLQVSLQDELKQIMSIRDGIDYNITQEAVNQFILLFHLVDETLHYHPNDGNNNSYHNLIESCEDFLENILQSLAMLGVVLINDVGVPFNIEKHRLVQGRAPVRKAIVSKVTKLGFIYKNKVIEKAEVEIVGDKV